MNFASATVIAFVIGSVASKTPVDWSSGIGSSYTYPQDALDTYTTAYINVTFTDSRGRIHTEKSEIAKFGEAHIGSSEGILVHVKTGNDDSGCTLPYRSSYGGSLPTGPWIALVRRGGCSFQVKVDNAHNSNASGIIIYNDRDTNTLDKMRLYTKDENNISAVFTYKWKGEELSKLLDNGTAIVANITIASHSRPYTNINRTSVLFVSISFVVLMIISLAWLVFYYVQRFRYIHAKDRLSRRLCSAAKKALSKIPTKHVKAEDKEVEGEGECCAICIEPFKLSEVLRILPCKHEFHKSCIDPWLLEHRTCPMCKMDILKHYGFVFTGSQESILDMDAEETGSESESLHNRNHSPLPRITPSDIQVSTMDERHHNPEQEERQPPYVLSSGTNDSIDGHSQPDPSAEELLTKPTTQPTGNEN